MNAMNQRTNRRAHRGLQGLQKLRERLYRVNAAPDDLQSGRGMEARLGRQKA